MSFKELKEAFKNLKASSYLLQKQLTNSKSRVDKLQSEKASLQRQINRSLAKQDQLKLKVSELNSEILLAKKAKEVSKEVSLLQSEVDSLNRRNSECSERSAKHSRQKYLQSKRADRLSQENKVLREEIRRLKRAPKEVESKVVIKTKVVKDKVYVDKVVKEPLPQKIRQLMLTDPGKTTVDIAAQVMELNWFSDKTKLTMKQMSVLLDALNLKYFKLGQLSSGSSSILRELEFKGLITGDRRDSRLAKGWFMTSKGKRVAEMIVNRLNRRTLNKDYIKNANR